MSTARLWVSPQIRISHAMRPILLLIALLVAAMPALALAADTKPPAKPARAATDANAPKSIGRFEDWQAATHVEAGQTVCYAFTRVKSSVPAVTGRGDVILTVTERPGTARDAVAFSAGFTYAPASGVLVQAETAALDFYTAGRSAFAREGKVAVAAFAKANQVLVRSPHPKSGNVTDTFSLRGFSKAYDAITKACPAK
jgi:hypothetical protein